MTHQILVVDDEPDITALVVYHLVKEGFSVSSAADGVEALEAVAERRPDLLVLDVMMPRKDGYEVLRDLRARPETADVGVILLTAKKEEDDRIEGLMEGADDYIVKPFVPRELVLRVKAVLRRLTAPASDEGLAKAIGPVSIDSEAHKVTVDGTDLALTATEYRLLTLLANRPGRVYSRAALLESVWGASPEIRTRTVDMHVQRLRSKLGAHEDLIETVRGFGYRFKAAD